MLRRALKPATNVVPLGAQAVMMTGSSGLNPAGFLPCAPLKARVRMIAIPMVTGQG